MNSKYDTAENYTNNTPDRQVCVWLLVCCAMVFFMVVLGGVTRLTGSGLSMVQWDPIFGVVPPLDQAAWEEVFELYMQSPEYRKVNIGMDLTGFKQIYWFEFAHRLLGRTIGMVFLIPFLFFLIKGYLHRPLIPRMIILFVLGGLQGLLGWYMVQSGLVDKPQVSQYRLTAHLALAIVIYAYMFWIALGLLPEQRQTQTKSGPPALRLFAGLLGILVFITALSGGFVAGLKAGHAYNTFPLMDGHLIPEVIFMQEPLWRNFFENIATVQFNHRVLAITTFIGVISLWIYGRRRAPSRQVRTGLHLLLLAGMLQVALGISTLLLHVPTPLAAAHQGGALLLLTLILFVNQRLVQRRI